MAVESFVPFDFPFKYQQYSLLYVQLAQRDALGASQVY